MIIGPEKRVSVLVCALASALAALVTGCNGASCESLCERAQSLGCGSAGCVSSCEDVRGNAERAGCGGEWQSVLNCQEENACTDPSVTCRDQLADLAGCATEFCVRNPSDPVCY